MEESLGADRCCVSLILIAAAVVLRLAYVLYRSGKPIKAPERVRTLIVLGSGGHTAEMLSVINVIQKDRFAPRFYVAAMTDSMSLQKAKVFEEGLDRQGEVVGLGWSSLFYIESIARARRLSLSGLLLYKLHMVDQFFVQWPQLQKTYPLVHYVGCLM